MIYQTLSLAAIMEGVSKYLKARDRLLTEHYHNLAVADNFNPVYNDNFQKVTTWISISISLSLGVNTQYMQITVPCFAALTVAIGIVCICAR